jgi:hypothetical protein
MAEFARGLFLWNDWVVFPALTVFALVLYARRRKRSTLLLSFGLVTLLAGQALLMAYELPLHPGHIAGLVLYSLGLIAAVVGSAWFLWKDCVATSK